MTGYRKGEDWKGEDAISAKPKTPMERLKMTNSAGRAHVPRAQATSGMQCVGIRRLLGAVEWHVPQP